MKLGDMSCYEYIDGNNDISSHEIKSNFVFIFDDANSYNQSITQNNGIVYFKLSRYTLSSLLSSYLSYLF